MSQTYDESKWAKAAAAAKDVIDLGRYELHTADYQDKGDNTYPATVKPPYNAIKISQMDGLISIRSNLTVPFLTVTYTLMKTKN